MSRMMKMSDVPWAAILSEEKTDLGDIVGVPLWVSVICLIVEVGFLLWCLL